MLHLAGRFVRSLWPLPPRRSDVAWVESVLTDAELALWSSQPTVDRRESIAVARRVAHGLAGTAHDGEPVWLAAALLHDVGKRDSRLGTILRSLATIAGALGGSAVERVWSQHRGLRGRVAAYLRHPEIGADAIAVAGGRAEAAEWAGAHHRPGSWGALAAIPEEVAHLLGAGRRRATGPSRRRSGRGAAQGLAGGPLKPGAARCRYPFIDTGYFVRAVPGARADPHAASNPGGRGADESGDRAPRGRTWRIRPLHLFLVAVAVVVGWAATTPGGIGARIDSMVGRAGEVVEGATEDSSLRDSATQLNARFDRDGAYPMITEALLRDDPELSWGVGVDVSWCSSRSVVLTALTGHGTISRLLLDGEVVGDADGAQACPRDLANPAPWTR